MAGPFGGVPLTEAARGFWLVITFLIAEWERHGTIHEDGAVVGEGAPESSVAASHAPLPTSEAHNKFSTES